MRSDRRIHDRLVEPGWHDDLWSAEIRTFDGETLELPVPAGWTIDEVCDVVAAIDALPETEPIA